MDASNLTMPIYTAIGVIVSVAGAALVVVWQASAYKANLDSHLGRIDEQLHSITASIKDSIGLVAERVMRDVDERLAAFERRLNDSVNEMIREDATQRGVLLDRTQQHSLTAERLEASDATIRAILDDTTDKVQAIERRVDDLERKRRPGRPRKNAGVQS